LNEQETAQLKKLLTIFFLGQVVGLPTLHSILKQYDISSNKHQIDYKDLCKKLTYNKIGKVFEQVFEMQILDVLDKMSQKDSSCWSRELVTALLDDSVFRQWQTSYDWSKDFEDCYGKFFSGQFKTSVYGFKVVTFALSIEGVVYPLYFDYVKKGKTKEDKAENAIEIAQKLVEKWGLFVKRAKNKGILIPKLHFSCDNGYSSVALSETCEANELRYISVPKKSHLFDIAQPNGSLIHTNLEDWINNTFLVAEKKHEMQQALLYKKEKTPFIYRFKANYCAQKREVTLLAFRLNGSKKVSIIYSTEKSIFAKTLRRHWFQRTYIEQFFKILKHVFKIQDARVKTKDAFHTKLLRFAFMAFHAQKLIKFIRSKFNQFDKFGFVTIQRLLCRDQTFFDLLQSFLVI
jgi:Transposase DDE domain